MLYSARSSFTFFTMLRQLWARVVLICIIALGLGFISAPTSIKQSVLGSTPDSGSIAESINNIKFSLGLDLQGGTQLRYRVDTSNIPVGDRTSVVEGIKGVMDRRINALGVSEAVVQTSQLGEDHYILVELPGVKDINEAINRVGKTVQLEFKEQKDEWSPEEKKANDQYNADVMLRARAILKDAEKPSADFTKIVKEKSEGKNISTGGEIDFQSENGVDPAIWPQISQLPAGKLVMIETPDAAYIEKILDTKKEEGVEANHILISFEGATRASPNVSRTKEEAKKLADEIKDRVTKDTFAKEVIENSDDALSNTKGGSLGTFTKGEMTKNFEDAAFAAQKDTIVGPIETEFGYHIIQIVDKTETVKVKRQELLLKKKPAKPIDGWVSTGLTGKQFSHANAAINSNGVGYIVQIQFNDEGKKLFTDLTKKNLNKPIGIFLDDEEISAPTVQTVIDSGEAIITGSFTATQANDLATNLNTGALPAPVILIGQNTVGATLGQDALANALKAGMIGLLVLVLFMLLYYRLPGLAALLGLTLYGIISAAVFQTFHITLSLAGIAGFILSIGMAVDANILIFERLKEELVSGKSLEASIKTGFNRAWSSIHDSNLSSLITCLILFIFGTNIIKGFAITLAIGILISMFTAINLTRTFIDLGHRWFKNPKFWKCGFSDSHSNIQFVKNDKLFFGFSGILIIITIISLFTNGLHAGIDFSGGTLMEIKFNQAVTTQQVQDAINKTHQVEKQTSLLPIAYAQKIADPSATTAASTSSLQEAESNPDLSSTVVQPTENNGFVLRMKHIDNDTRQKLLDQFKAINDNQDVQELRFETIGPTIGATLKTNAFKSLAVAVLFIILFVTYAFRKLPKTLNPWRFGIVAVVALIHDLIITVGVFSVFNLEVDTLFITALLTVMGFSVHDTIVVFDRVRENVIRSTGKASIGEIVNRSLNETLARSINTSLTTLITLLALFIFAGSTIRNFVLALIVGIAVGTYSSIFIASLLLVVWHKATAPKSANKSRK